MIANVPVKDVFKVLPDNPKGTIATQLRNAALKFGVKLSQPKSASIRVVDGTSYIVRVATRFEGLRSHFIVIDYRGEGGIVYDPSQPKSEYHHLYIKRLRKQSWRMISVMSASRFLPPT